MQMISREKFLKLASLPNAVEADNAFSYPQFVKQMHEIYDSYKRVYSTYCTTKKHILKKLCPPIQFCGEGSSRAAYALAGGKCLKVAMEEKGVAQNKQELKVCKSNSQYSCFPNYYDYDSKLYLSLITDCCMEANDSDFRRIYGISCQGIWNVVKKFFETEKPPEAAAKTVVLSYYDTGDGRAFEDLMQDICRGIGSGKQLKFKVFHDLLQYYYDNGSDDSDLLLDDLDRPDNFGIHIVDGQQVPVIIDAGLSEDVYNTFYR